MTNKQWINQARVHKDDLLDLMANYHPRSDGFRSGGMPITAKAVEVACQTVRSQIAAEPATYPPTVAFVRALDNNDVETAMSLISDTWFGVPESTDCWRLRGFKEAVDLLDDPPEVEE